MALEAAGNVCYYFNFMRLLAGAFACHNNKESGWKFPPGSRII